MSHMNSNFLSALALSVILITASLSAQVSIIHNFNGTDGANPGAGVIQVGNTLYGITSASGGSIGGKSCNGNIFRVNLDGTGFTVLCCLGKRALP